DRPLWSIEARLIQGEDVELIPNGGPPRWSNWPLFQADARLDPPTGDYMLTAGPDLCCLELLPDSKRHSYHITAEIEHRQGDRLSEVGIYFGMHSVAWETDSKVLCLMGFNDARSTIAHKDKGDLMTSQIALYLGGTIGPNITATSGMLRRAYFVPTGEINK